MPTLPDPEHYSSASRERFDGMPGTVIVASDDVGWRSLLVDYRAMPSVFEYQPAPTPDQTVCVTVR